MSVISSLGLISGRGVYPRLLAEAAKKQGVTDLFAVAFRGETDRVIQRVADRVAWIHMGQYGKMLDAFEGSGVKHAVMAGQITPTNLFRVRPDARLFALLQRLKVRNAETIFSAVADDLRAIGIEVLPASTFMEEHMPAPGVLTRRGPSDDEQRDIALGLKVAKATSGLDIGQTVVVKQGTILALEAFEGTNDAIRRAAELGGAGIVIVKVAKQGHDMRFDIPVVGEHTLKLLRKVKAAVLAVEAHRTILLDRPRVVQMADAIGLCLVALGEDGAG
jgi:DUF1009 family protein